MKLHSVTWVDDRPDDGSEPGPKVQWLRTQETVMKLKRQLKSAGMRDIEEHITYLPDDVANMIVFLNERQVMP